MKHTAGPWRVHTPTGTDKRMFVMHPDGSRIIAKMDEGYVSNRGEIAEQERISNTYLIAAAPDLLEALNLLIDFIPQGWEVPLGYMGLVEQARQAIAKAERKA